VFEGTTDNYMFNNDLKASDFDQSIPVYSGPMITVLGTSLQNRDMLRKFQSDWRTVGLEMEGGHYQRAISAATIKGDIPKRIKSAMRIMPRITPWKPAAPWRRAPWAKAG